MEPKPAARRKPKPPPDFASEEEEMRFWDEHDPSDYIEGPADLTVRLKRRKSKGYRCCEAAAKAVLPAPKAEGEAALEGAERKRVEKRRNPNSTKRRSAST
jgi:hypothetical protein